MVLTLVQISQTGDQLYNDIIGIDIWTNWAKTILGLQIVFWLDVCLTHSLDVLNSALDSIL